MKEYFYDLTPEKVIQAIEQCGFIPTGRVFPMNSYENRVFDVYLENSPNIIIKFYRPGRWSKEQIQEEHDFIFDLHESEIPVSRPVEFSDKSTIKEISGIYYSVWDKIGGRAPDEFTEEEIAVIGRLIARIHKTGSAGNSVHRPTFNSEEYVEKSISFLEENQFLPKSCVRRYADSASEISRIFSELSHGIPIHRIHGDCHKGNLLCGSGGWFFLDFDDFANGHAVQDIWMLLPSSGDTSDFQRNIFLEAYREFADFDDGWLELIEPLRAFRFIHYAAWIAKRWDDPAFPALFPHFGTSEYWEKETNDLENQLKIILKSSHKNVSRSFAEQAEEPELTNKDFFWDM